MMIRIDISIFQADGRAFGNLSGAMQLPVTPGAGDVISCLSMSQDEYQLPIENGFSGLLKVAGRILDVGDAGSISIALEAITVGTREDALAVASYFEKTFNWFLVDYGT
jgi:hypothetical protein